MKPRKRPLGRRLYAESSLPMTTVEYAIFREAFEHSRKKNLTKSNAFELARRAGDRAVVKSRGPTLSAAERTLDMFAPERRGR